MSSCLSAETMLSKHVSKRDRILLVNPPVQDTRYAWLHWNQPFDLLRIGAFLKQEAGCKVDLLDFMKPDAEGGGSKTRLCGDRQNRNIGAGRFAHRYPMWRFGQDYDEVG